MNSQKLSFTILVLACCFAIIKATPTNLNKKHTSEIEKLLDTEKEILDVEKRIVNYEKKLLKLGDTVHEKVKEIKSSEDGGYDKIFEKLDKEETKENKVLSPVEADVIYGVKQKLDEQTKAVIAEFKAYLSKIPGKSDETTKSLSHDIVNKQPKNKNDEEVNAINNEVNPVAVEKQDAKLPTFCTLKKQWKKVGCFSDRMVPNRPLPVELLNLRDNTNPINTGFVHDWRNFDAVINTMLCECAKKAKAKGYEYFGLQYYGECWSGPGAKYGRDGISKDCVGGDFKPCHDGEYCVGKAHTNYVYKLEAVANDAIENADMIPGISTLDTKTQKNVVAFEKYLDGWTIRDAEQITDNKQFVKKSNDEDKDDKAQLTIGEKKSANTISKRSKVLVTAAKSQSCTKIWKKAGCFHDRVKPAPRPLPNELWNMRDRTNPANGAANGYILSWTNYGASLNKMLCECARLAKEKGYQFFGLQFFGECWSGPGANFARDGPSKNCIGSNFKPCNEKDPESACVGRQFTNFVYKLVDQGKDANRIDGKWGSWEEWSVCDKMCGGGLKKRYRECNNPEPSEYGLECEGDDMEQKPCNIEKCEKVPCKERIDIGIIMDASGSVKKANYEKMKDFLVKLTRVYTVNSQEVNFGLLHYSSRAYLDFQINNKKYHVPEQLEKKIKSTYYTMGSTRTDKALYLADKKFFCSYCHRKGVQNVLLVLTDGKSNSGAKNMTLMSKNMKSQGVKVISIGIGKGAYKPELLEIASAPEDVVMIEDFKYLVEKINLLLRLSCERKSVQGDENSDDEGVANTIEDFIENSVEESNDVEADDDEDGSEEEENEIEDAIANEY